MLLAVLVAGCATEDDRNLAFGDSVRHTIALQTANPSAAGTGLDAVKATAALSAYRKDVAKPEETTKQQLTVKFQ